MYVEEEVVGGGAESTCSDFSRSFHGVPIKSAAYYKDRVARVIFMFVIFPRKNRQLHKQDYEVSACQKILRAWHQVIFDKQ